MNQTIFYHPTLFPVKIVEEYVVYFDSKETNSFNYQNMAKYLSNIASKVCAPKFCCITCIDFSTELYVNG